MYSRKGAAEAAVEGVVSQQDRVVAGIGRLAGGAGHLGLGVVDAAQLGAVTVESVDGASCPCQWFVSLYPSGSLLLGPATNTDSTLSCVSKKPQTTGEKSRIPLHWE